MRQEMESDTKANLAPASPWFSTLRSDALSTSHTSIYITLQQLRPLIEVAYFHLYTFHFHITSSFGKDKY